MKNAKFPALLLALLCLLTLPVRAEADIPPAEEPPAPTETPPEETPPPVPPPTEAPPEETPAPTETPPAETPAPEEPIPAEPVEEEPAPEETPAEPAGELTPVILRQPKNAEVDYGGRAVLSVEAECSGGILSYQWYMCASENKSGLIPLGTGAEQTVDSRRAGTWYYFVRVSCTDGERIGETDSSLARVRVGGETPRVTEWPESVTVKVGDRCVLTVEAELKGEGELSFVWFQSTRPDLNTMTAMNRGKNMGSTLAIDTSRPAVRYYYVEISSEENGEIEQLKSDVVTVQIVGPELTAPAATEAPAETPVPTEKPPLPTPEPLPPSVTLEEEAGEVEAALPVRLGAAAMLGGALGVFLAGKGQNVLRRGKQKRR